MLHCKSSADRFESAKALLNYGFANYALVSAEAPEALPAVRVRLGKTAQLQPVLQESSPILIEKGMQSSVTKAVTLAEEVTAPVAAGQELGKLRISAGSQVLAEIPIIAPEAVEKLSWWDLTVRLLKNICMGA